MTIRCSLCGKDMLHSVPPMHVIPLAFCDARCSTAYMNNEPAACERAP